MDFKIIPRNEWGAKPPTKPLSAMTQPDGWVVHYVGGPMQQDPTLAQSISAVYNLQQGAFNGDNGEVYIDIPYNFLIDLNGRIFEGRGFDYKSGANGSSNYNGHAWAVCVLMGPGDGHPEDKNHLTQEAKDALSWLTRKGASLKPAVSYVKGHRDVYATHCPGDECYEFVPYLNQHLHDADPTTPPSTEDDMTPIFLAPAWQTTDHAYPAFAEVDLVNKVVNLGNGALISQKRTIPSAEPLISAAETPDGFVVLARRAAGEIKNHSYYFTWKTKP